MEYFLNLLILKYNYYTKTLLFIIFFSTYTMSAQLVLNEALFDPAPGLAGDANRDGIRADLDDEFVEFVNTSARSLDISGYQVFDITGGTEVLRHTVPEATIIPAGRIYVVFGEAYNQVLNNKYV